MEMAVVRASNKRKSVKIKRHLFREGSPQEKESKTIHSRPVAYTDTNTTVIMCMDIDTCSLDSAVNASLESFFNKPDNFMRINL